MKIALILTGILAILAVVTYLCLPWIAAWVLRDKLPRLEQAIGREITFSDLELDGLTHVRIHDLTIKEANGEADFVQIERVEVALTGNPVWTDAKVASIDVYNPSGTLRIAADGTSNVDDLAEKITELLEKKPSEDDGGEGGGLSRYLKPFPPVRVHGGQLRVEDAGSRPFYVDAIEGASLTLTRFPEEGTRLFDIESEMVVTYHARKRELETRTVRVNGRVGKPLERLKVEVDFVEGLELELAPLGMQARLHLDRVAVEMPDRVALEDLLLVGPEGIKRPLLAAGSLTLSLDGFQPSEIAEALADRDMERLRSALHITRVDLNELRANVVIEKDGSLQPFSLTPKGAGSDTPVVRRASRVRRNLMRGARAGTLGLMPEEGVGADVFAELREVMLMDTVSLLDAELRIDDRRPGGAGVTTLSGLDLAVMRDASDALKMSLSFALGDGELALSAEEGGEAGLVVRANVNRLSLGPLMTLAMGVLAKRSGLVKHLPKLLSVLKLDETRLDTELELSLPPGGDVSLGGMVRVRDLHIAHPVLSDAPLDNIDMRLDFEARYARGEQRLTVKPLEVRMGEARFQAEARFDSVLLDVSKRELGMAGESMDFAVAFAIPKQPAQAIFEAVPYGLRHQLDGLQFEGDIGYRVSLEGEYPKLSEDPELEIIVQAEGLRVARWPLDYDIRAMNRGMMLSIKDPNALMPHEVEIPPSLFPVLPRTPEQMQRTGFAEDVGHLPVLVAEDIRDSYPDWVLLEDMSPYLIQMVLTTEDGSFFYHTGFSRFQIIKALEENIDAGRFERGASTISMQLVKNLFLGRSKTLARKLQEVVMTWMMESMLKIPKGRQLEIYFNIIEWGPEIYGIREAARHYFGKRAADLTLTESAFLASIIPGPRKGNNHWVRGELPERGITKLMRWYMEKMYERRCEPDKQARYLRTFERMGQPVPFELNCPPYAVFEMHMQDRPEFYKPGIDDPPYRPEMYFEDGTPKPTMNIPMPGLPRPGGAAPGPGRPMVPGDRQPGPTLP